MVFVKKSLKFTQLAEYTIKAIGSTYEQLVFKLNHHIIIIFYKPPLENISRVLKAWEEILINECSSTVIPIFVGDINFDVTQFPVMNFLREMSLKNYQTSSTRAGRVLDICISYSNGAHLNSQTLEEFAYSDHVPIIVNISEGPRKLFKEKFEYYRDRKNFTFSNFNSALMNISWQDFETEIENLNIASALEIFTQNMSKVFTSLAPIRRRKNGNKFFPNEIMCWIKTRNALFKLASATGDNDVRTEYKRIRNFVKSLIRSFERNRVGKKLESCNKDFHKTWGVLNEMMGRKQRNTVEVDSETLNDFFARPKEWSNVDPIQIRRNVVPGEVSLREIQYATFFKALQTIPTHRAPGLDGISAEMLKLAKHFLAPKILKLFNLVIKSGDFPDQWKLGKVVALYKNNGDVKDPGNYRPITLLPIMSKLFEKCISEQMYELLIPHIPNFQHGFKRNHSIVTAMTEITEYMFESLNDQKMGYVAQLDISKAYDSVNNYILLQKVVDLVQPSPTMEKLMTNYLFGRRICTHAQGVTSSSRDISVGIPQGSVLSPILFNFYMADISELSLFGTIVAFADDVQLLYNVTKIEENEIEAKIDADVRKIEAFLNERFMKLNNSKTMITRYGSRHQLSKVDPNKCFMIRVRI